MCIVTTVISIISIMACVNNESQYQSITIAKRKAKISTKAKIMYQSMAIMAIIM